MGRWGTARGSQGDSLHRAKRAVLGTPARRRNSHPRGGATARTRGAFHSVRMARILVAGLLPTVPPSLVRDLQHYTGERPVGGVLIEYLSSPNRKSQIS